MTSPSRAIILAAGQGKRLLPLTESRPKCLVELSGRTLLAWQLLRLQAAGVGEAVVVTGFRADAVETEVRRLNLEMPVRTVFNPFYAVADNLASCWLVRGEFDRDVLLLNGDTLFGPGVAERLIAAPPAEITVTVDRKASYDADDMKVLSDADGRLKAIGKTIEAYDAESIGFLRLSVAGAARFAAGVDAALQRQEGLRRWYLSVIDELAKSGTDVRIASIEGLEWGEMDFPADVENLTRLSRDWALESVAAE